MFVMPEAVMAHLDYLPPFRLCGDFFHVGGKRSPSYLLDTGDGLLMIDTGFPKTASLIFLNMQQLGYDPRNIRWILHSHGHIDHFGSTRLMMELFGAKSYLGAADREIANGTLDLSWAKELGLNYYETFEPDYLINDGDELQFGKIRIKCLSTPGHSPGVISYFFELEENGRKLHAGSFGGVGFLSMKLDFLRQYGLSPRCREEFLANFARLRQEKVDVFYGNHLSNFDYSGKLARRTAGEKENPFVDPEEWGRFLDKTEQNFREFLAADLPGREQ